MKTGGHDAKRTKFHMNVPLSYIEFVPVKQNMRELLLCLMSSLHVKNNLKMYKNVEKGRSKCKKSCGEQKKRIH